MVHGGMIQLLLLTMTLTVMLSRGLHRGLHLSSHNLHHLHASHHLSSHTHHLHLCHGRPTYTALKPTTLKTTYQHEAFRLYASTASASDSGSDKNTDSDTDTDTDKKRLVFLGTPSVAADSLGMLHAASIASSDSCYEIVAVVSQPPAPSGRKKKLTPSPVHQLAEKLNLPLLIPESAKDASFLSALEALQVDLCVTAGRCHMSCHRIRYDIKGVCNMYHTNRHNYTE
jgi:hypothetical protein